MNPEISEPRELCVLLDCDGDAVELCCMQDDVIQSCLRVLDRENPDDAPHSAWAWSGGRWRRWE